MSKERNFEVPQPCELNLDEIIKNIEERERRCDETGGCSDFRVIKCNEYIYKYLCRVCGRKYYRKGGEIYEP